MLETINRMELRISEMEGSLHESNEQYNDVKMETMQLMENEARLNETIESLESQLSAGPPLVPEDSSYSSSSPAALAYEDPDYEVDDRTEALVSESCFEFDWYQFDLGERNSTVARSTLSHGNRTQWNKWRSRGKVRKSLKTTPYCFARNVQLDTQDGEIRLLHDRVNEMKDNVIEKWASPLSLSFSRVIDFQKYQVRCLGRAGLSQHGAQSSDRG